jgi:hypothetical protein
MDPKRLIDHYLDTDRLSTKFLALCTYESYYFVNSAVTLKLPDAHSHKGVKALVLFWM